jgi:hypothetical protein
MGNDDDRDLRDRVIRLEEGMKGANEKLAGFDKKMWAVIALVFVAVGKRLLEIIGLGP